MNKIPYKHYNFLQGSPVYDKNYLNKNRDVQDQSLKEFINDPSNITILALENPRITDFINENPYIRVGTKLPNGYQLLYMPKDKYYKFVENFGVDFVYGAPFLMGLMVDKNSQNDIVENNSSIKKNPNIKYTGKGVLIGFIDTGIDYTKNIFNRKDGTSRIRYIWDMTVDGNSPQDMYIGTEYTNEQINEALKSNNPFEVVPHVDNVGHGTFLASVAAGGTFDNQEGIATESEIIMVKIREANEFYRQLYMIPESNTNVYESTLFLLGIKYIVDKADSLNMPAVICISLGTNEGNHDGNGFLEQFISILARKRGLVFCSAAGNESASGHHYSGKLTNSNKSEFIEVSVPRENTDVFVTLYANINDTLSVSVMSPGGERLEYLNLKAFKALGQTFIKENTSVEITPVFPVIRNQFVFIKIKNSMQGIWTIKVMGDKIVDGQINAWLPVTGLAPEGIKFTKSNPYNTIVVPGTSIGVVTCGAYNTSTNILYKESSWGPISSKIVLPTIIAPGVNVKGMFPTGTGVMSGTSVAAAVTSGFSALYLHWNMQSNDNSNVNSYTAQTFFINGAVQETGFVYPNPKWGYGRINFYNSILKYNQI